MRTYAHSVHVSEAKARHAHCTVKAAGNYLPWNHLPKPDWKMHIEAYIIAVMCDGAYMHAGGACMPELQGIPIQQ